MEVLSGLSPADHIRMERLARMYANRSRGMDWQDLLNTALERILSGSRQWPRQLPFWGFLPGVLRSVASQMREQLGREATPFSVLAVAGEDPGEVADNLAVDAATPATILADQELLAEIENLFTDDELAYAVILARQEGLSPAETMVQFEMTKTEYDSAQRRVRRAFLKRGWVGK